MDEKYCSTAFIINKFIIFEKICKGLSLIKYQTKLFFYKQYLREFSGLALNNLDCWKMLSSNFCLIDSKFLHEKSYVIKQLIKCKIKKKE